MSMKRYSWPVRFCSVLMALVLAVFIVGQPRAKAVAVIDDVAVGAMSCEAFLASIGLPLTATGGSTAVTAGITAAAGEYAAATGAAASGEAFLGTVAAGTAISTAGAIVLTAAAAVAVGAFAYWVYETYLTDASGSESSEPIQVYHSDSKVGYLMSDGSLLVTNDNKVIGNATMFQFGTTYYLATGHSFNISLDDAGRVYYYADGKLLDKSSKSSYKFDYYWLGYGANAYMTGESGLYGYYSFYVKLGISSDEFWGEKIEKGAESLSVINYDYQPIPDEELGSARQMVLDVGAPAGATLEELAQSIPEQVASNSLNVTYTIVSPDEGSEGGAPEVNPNPDVEPPEDIAPYTVGLGEVFPFCIPFDIYHMVTMFAAEPEAPAATWEFTLPWSGQACEVSWSLEKWDEVAELCRSLELVLFCVGLAAATYKMIKW